MKSRKFPFVAVMLLLLSGASAQSPLQVGYGLYTPEAGNRMPVGSALFRVTNAGGVIVSEAAVGAIEPIASGRVFVDQSGAKTGLALANNGPEAASIAFILRNAAGAETARVSDTLGANRHTARYVSDLFPSQSADFRGSLTFESTRPIAAVTLRETRNVQGEPLYTTLPVVTLPAGSSNSPLVFPHIAAGDGFTTELLLMNPYSESIRGDVRFYGSTGQPLLLQSAGSSVSQIPYDIPAHGTFRAVLDAPALRSGWSTAVPSAGSAAPSGSIVFQWKASNQIVSEAGVAATPATTASRVFIDNAGTQTGVAIANPSTQEAQLTLTLMDRNGNVEQVQTRPLAGGNHLAIYANDLFSVLTEGFTGVMEIQSTVAVAPITLKLTVNTRNDLVMTTLPVADLNRLSSAATLIFPQIAIGTNFSTRLVFINTDKTAAAGGRLSFYQSDGNNMVVPMGAETGSQFLYRMAAGGGRQFYPGNTARVAAITLMDPSSNTETTEVAINEGNTLRPRVRVIDSSGQSRDDYDVTYTSSNTAIAEVNPDSSIKGKVAGFSSLTMSSGGVVSPGTVTVVRVELGTGGFGTVGIAQDLAQRLYLTSSQDHTISLAQDVRQAPAIYAGIAQSPGLKNDMRLQSQFRNPSYLAFNQAEGSLYVADSANHVVRRVRPGASGAVETMAGNGTPGSRDGPLMEAQFNTPQGIALDPRGNLWIVDTGNHTIRRINPAAGTVETIAGTPGVPGFADGRATAAQFRSPTGIAIETESSVRQLERERRGEPPPPISLIVADTANGVLRRVQENGTVETVRVEAPRGAGIEDFKRGVTSAVGAPFYFNSPTGVLVDSSQNIYVTESSRLKLVVRIESVVVTVTQENTFVRPRGLTTAANGTVVVADGAFGARQLSYGAPQIASVSPQTVSNRGGERITIRGTNFSTDSVVIIGGTVISGAAVQSTETITFTAPALGSGRATVTIQNRGGIAQAALVVQPQPLTSLQVGYITTVAGGTTFAGDGGPAASANIVSPKATAIDATGAVYIADRDAHQIRRVNPVSGAINTVAGSGQRGFSGDFGLAIAAELDTPGALAIDAAGNLFVTDANNNRVRRVDRVTGIITTFAGGGRFDRLGDGSPASSAYLLSPSGIAFDRSDNLYISDSGNRRIRKVDASTGIITTIAGNGQSGFSGDGGPATSAQIWNPAGIVISPAGDVFFSDQFNGRIRKIAAGTGIITTIAGTGSFGISGSNIPAISAALSSPDGLSMDADGNLYLSETRIRKINTDGIITTVAGGGGQRAPATGSVPATSVSLTAGSVSVDAAGNLFITDGLDKRVYRVSGAGMISVFAGIGGGSVGDGEAATAATLSRPSGVAFDSGGNMLIGDGSNNRLRRVDARTGVMTTIAGNGVFSVVLEGDRPATSVSIGAPNEVALDGAGNIYLLAASQILKISAATGTLAVIAGFPTPARFISATGLAVDSAGNAYFSDQFEHRVRRISPDGAVTTIAGTGTAGFSGDGGPAAAAALDSPWGLALDGAGNLYICDRNNGRIRKIALSTETITTHASDVFSPTDLTFDRSGNLFILENGNTLIRISSAGQVQNIASTSFDQRFFGDNGPAIAASFYFPQALAVDSEGNIFVADSYNNRIRAIRGPLP